MIKITEQNVHKVEQELQRYHLGRYIEITDELFDDLQNDKIALEDYKDKIDNLLSNSYYYGCSAKFHDYAEKLLKRYMEKTHGT